jgi:hypothetical protein
MVCSALPNQSSRGGGSFDGLGSVSTSQVKLPVITITGADDRMIYPSQSQALDLEISEYAA